MLPTTPELEQHFARLRAHDAQVPQMGRPFDKVKHAAARDAIAADIFRAERNRIELYIKECLPGFTPEAHAPGTAWDDLMATAAHLDCGCVNHYIWSKKHSNDERTYTAIKIEKTCPAHAHISNPADHFNTVVVEKK